MGGISIHIAFWKPIYKSEMAFKTIFCPVKSAIWKLRALKNYQKFCCPDYFAVLIFSTSKCRRNVVKNNTVKDIVTLKMSRLHQLKLHVISLLRDFSDWFLDTYQYWVSWIKVNPLLDEQSKSKTKSFEAKRKKNRWICFL